MVHAMDRTIEKSRMASDRCSTASSLPCPKELIASAWPEICKCAAEVGIDLQKTAGHIPPSGELVRGRQVPVIAPRYKGACYFLYFENTLRGGDRWPYFHFATHKDGGRTMSFNGLRWWQAGNMPAAGSRSAGSLTVRPFRSAHHDEKASRLRRIVHADRAWKQATPVCCETAWINERLCGHATESLIDRVELRHLQSDMHDTLMAPLASGDHQQAGYQLIHVPFRGGVDCKRTHVRPGFSIKGASIRIRSMPNQCGGPVAICEGLATGLTIAMVWPGEVRIALCASNIAAVRKSVSGPVTFFHDHDIWKPTIGNVGLAAASQASRPGDQIITPTFSRHAQRHRPTDFNDLLKLEGSNALASDVSSALIQERTSD